MGKISRALALVQTGEYDGAADTLRELLDDIEVSSEWASICEWIAQCFEKLGRNEEAAGWFETAGQIILVQETSPIPRRTSEALYYFEKASACYAQCKNDDSRLQTRAVIQRLEQVCAPA